MFKRSLQLLLNRFFEAENILFRGVICCQGVLDDNLGELEKKIFLRVSRLSTKGSWKTFLIPEWSLNEYGMDVRSDIYKH